MGIYVTISVLFALLFAGCMFYVDVKEDRASTSDKKPPLWRKAVWDGFWSVIVGLGFYAVNYFSTPTISIHNLAIYLEVFLLIVLMLCVLQDRLSILWGLLCSLPIIGLITAIYSWDLCHAEHKQKMLSVEEVSDSVMTRLISPIKVDKMCTVSPEVAQRVISTQLGDLKNTYSADRMTKQSFTGHFTATLFNGQKVEINYDNHLIYVAVLEHKSFFTWKKQSYSPGYVIVDASNEKNVYVIKEVNGEPLKIRYTKDAYFSCNMERYLRFNGYSGVILDDLNIELDENGRPHSPVTLMENTIALGTPVVTGVAVLDVQSGEIKEYSVEDAPEFVNMIQPEDLIYDRLYAWGEYVYGYFHFSEKENLRRACDGMDVVQTEDGCYYYVGIQAANDNVGTKGYMLIDTRTGKAKYFKRDGISEQEAAKVLEANTDLNLEMTQGVLELTEPLFYNIEGLKTYFATYVSTKDITVKYYGFCSADDKNVWGYGTSPEEAVASYLASYYKNQANYGNKITTDGQKNEIVLEVEILEKVQEGNVYYFRCKNADDKVFFSSSATNPDIRWQAKKARIRYNQTDAREIPVGTYEIIER